MAAAVTTRYVSEKCTVCSHERRYFFDVNLVMKRITQAEVARQVGVSKMSVSRHFRNHLLPELADYLTRQRDAADLDIAQEISHLYADLKHRYSIITGANDQAMIPRYHAELRKDLELLGRIHGDIKEAEIRVEVHQTQQSLEFIQVILEALKPFPDARLAVAARIRADEP